MTAEMEGLNPGARNRDLVCRGEPVDVDVNVDVNRFYIYIYIERERERERALFSALEQTHCAVASCDSERVTLRRVLNIHRGGVLTALFGLLHGRCHVKLLPSRRKFCEHYTTMHHVTSLHAEPHTSA